MTVTGLKALLDMHNHEDELWIGNPKLPRKELESQVEKILTENPDAIHKLDYRESFFKLIQVSILSNDHVQGEISNEISAITA